MKADIHPEYYPEAKVICACGATWTTGSTVPEIRTDICSNCHPFYTGQQRIVDTAGQVERFMSRLRQYGEHTEAQQQRRERSREKAQQTFMNQQLIALDLDDRLFQILSDADFVTIRDVAQRLETDPDSLLALEGFGPKALEQLQEKLETAQETFEAARA